MRHLITLLAILSFAGLHADTATKNEVDALVASIGAAPMITLDSTIANPFTGSRPSRPAASQKTAAPKSIQFQGVVNKKALINGGLYGVGQDISGYRLESVTEKGITLSHAGRTYTYSLTPTSGSILLQKETNHD